MSDKEYQKRLKEYGLAMKSIDKVINDRGNICGYYEDVLQERQREYMMYYEIPFSMDVRVVNEANKKNMQGNIKRLENAIEYERSRIKESMDKRDKIEKSFKDVL